MKQLGDNFEPISDPLQEPFYKAFVVASDLYYHALSIDSTKIGDLEMKLDKVLKFKEKLINMGYVPTDFLLWHKLVGSTVDTSGKIYSTDTPNKDIEKFIREIFHMKD